MVMSEALRRISSEIPGARDWDLEAISAISAPNLGASLWSQSRRLKPIRGGAITFGHRVMLA